MPTIKTAAALKHLIQLKLDALDEVQDDDEQIYAREVEWHAPDASGCNWDMTGYRGPAGYGLEVRVLVNALRREYRLAEDSSLFR
ncbi:MAG: hypothetical protein ACXWUS_14670 [Burkholderiales bacterium]